jgi:hypothetical protein
MPTGAAAVICTASVVAFTRGLIVFRVVVFAVVFVVVFLVIVAVLAAGWRPGCSSWSAAAATGSWCLCGKQAAGPAPRRR